MKRMGNEQIQFKIQSVIYTRGLCFSKDFFEGLIFGGAYFRRGLLLERNLHFKLGWAYNNLEGNLCRQFCNVQMIIFGR